MCVCGWPCYYVKLSLYLLSLCLCFSSPSLFFFLCLSVSTSLSLSLPPSPSPLYTAPELSVTLYTLYNDELIEGTYTDLICNATNIDTSLTNVTWYYNEEPLVNGSDYTIGLKEGRQALTINQLSFSRDNGGVYKCVMTVPNSTYVIGTEDSANITLSVQSEPIKRSQKSTVHALASMYYTY